MSKIGRTAAVERPHQTGARRAVILRAARFHQYADLSRLDRPFPSYADLVTRNARYTYGTHGSPTTDALETAWTEIAGAAGTVLAPSGLSAVALAILTAVKAGDHILVSNSVYRPTRNFCERF